MGLQFYIGNSGTGKSYMLYQRVLREAQAHPKQQYLVLVPEQFTMQTQKDFVNMSARGGILNIDILSFQRLAYRIFEETHSAKLPVLDEIGKIFVVRRVAEEKAQQLVLMKHQMHRIGYINEVKSMISEFIQYDVQGDVLNRLLEENRSQQQIYGKLHDMKVIYEGFKDYLKEKFITSEELLEVLCHVVEQSEILRNCTIIMDGFTGFTPVQKKLLEKLMVLCRDMWVTVTYDTSEAVREQLPDYHLFHMSGKMMQDLSDMAKQVGVVREKDVLFLAKNNYRFQNQHALAALERNLFRSRMVPYEDKIEGIGAYVCQNPLSEMHFVAQEIRRLIMEEGYRYRDIAVVTGDLAEYGDYATRMFERFGIPYFSDYKRNALANPAVACIRSLLECAVQDFSYESVGRLWRSGLVPIDMEVLDRLQNYILAKGIRGIKRWKEPWMTLVRGMSEEELEELNGYREQFITPLVEFAACIRSKRTTVIEKTVQLYKLMEQYKMQEQLRQFEEEFTASGEAALGREYAQIYRVIIGILERLTQMLGSEKMDGQQYAELLDAGFAEMKVGVIPPGVDQVTIGDIERSRLKDIRALFFVGVNDGVIPKSKLSAGILSELERENLREQGIELAPGREEQYYTQRFYLYLNLTKPSERLYLTYSKVDASGAARNPSYLITTMRQLFPQLKLCERNDTLQQVEQILSVVDGMEFLIEHRAGGDRPKGYFALYRWFERQQEYQNRLRLLRSAAREGRGSDRIHAALAKALYTDELSGSVTRLEQYAACAYAHFLQYGIGLREREEYGFDSLDFGNILHSVLDCYAKELAKRHILWTQLSEKEQEELVEYCVDETVLQYDSTVLYYSARDRYRIVRMKRIAKRTVWALTRQLAKGTFVPSRYELQFHNTEEIKNGLQEAARLNLRGRIDRMDICEKEDKVYVKVVDYKTGRKEFQLLNVYYGLQLQLIVYLQAAMQFEGRIYQDKEILPAGVVYYRVDDPVIEANRSDADGVEKEILRTLRVDGVFSEDSAVLSAVDEELGKAEQTGDSYESDVAPVGLKRGGVLTKRSKTIQEEEFNLMMRYADARAKRMGEQILSGDITTNPYEDGKDNACMYCAYAALCMQDDNGKPKKMRRLEKLSEEEIYERMREELTRNREQQEDNRKEERT